MPGEPVQEAIPVQEPKKRGRKAKVPVVDPVSTTPEVQPESPPAPKKKRKCSEKQLAALAAGRAKNKHFKPKQVE